MRINLVFPVLNEERRLQRGIDRTEVFLKRHPDWDVLITIADNGSTDRTPEVIHILEEKYDNITHITLGEKGFGLAFREAVKVNDCDIIGYVDCDLSTDIRYLTQVLAAFEKHPEYQIIKGNRLSARSKVQGRKMLRNITSVGLNWMIKLFFLVKVSDTMEGFQFFRKGCIDDLVSHSSDDKGWFYCAELLIRAEKMGYRIGELPVKWKDDYDTKVNVKKLIVNYLTRMIALKKDFLSYGYARED